MRQTKENIIQASSISSKYEVGASPVLKWAGGKTQLLPMLNQHYPKELIDGKIDTYIEPFVGSGAVFFYLSNNHHIGNSYLFDINPELVILYNSLKENVDRVIDELGILSDYYLSLKSEAARKEQFYNVREQYNSEVALAHKAINHTPFNATRAATTIFLNRTCFNGLFRVNKKSHFNVPHGRYKNPTILFKDKLKAAAVALQNATIKLADFSTCEKYISGKTFIYYDPPYRPLSETSHFTSYSQDKFGDDEQIRLARTIRKLSNSGVLQLLSNSDPSNYATDRFFDDLYEGFNIHRVEAKRLINSNPDKRGTLRELLIRNY